LTGQHHAMLRPSNKSVWNSQASICVSLPQRPQSKGAQHALTVLVSASHFVLGRMRRGRFALRRSSGAGRAASRNMTREGQLLLAPNPCAKKVRELKAKAIK
jgi:hypothetical protein